MVIYAAGEEDQPPGLPRKSRKETRETNPDHALPLTEDNQDDLETTRPALTPSAQHRRNPSRRRKSPDFLNKEDFIYSIPKPRNHRKVKPVTNAEDQEDEDLYVDMDMSKQDQNF